MELTKDVSVDLALVGVGGVRGGGVGVRRGVAGVSIAGRGGLPSSSAPHQLGAQPTNSAREKEADFEARKRL